MKKFIFQKLEQDCSCAGFTIMKMFVSYETLKIALKTNIFPKSKAHFHKINKKFQISMHYENEINLNIIHQCQL